MEQVTVKELYNLEETIAQDIFDGVTYPWEVLPKISDYILELGKQLDESKYNKVGEEIWIAKSAKVAPTAYIAGPAIIGENAEIRHCAFIRGKVIVGENAVVGNSTELKNVILFNNVPLIDLESIIKTNENPQQKTDQLISLANANGTAATSTSWFLAALNAASF